MTEHPITPPPELVQQWGHDANLSGVPYNDEHWAYEQHIATRAAQWGADHELEACCEWLVSEGWFKYEHEAVEDLRAARRPKPPSLKKQALLVLDDANLDAAHHNILLRALEQLDD
jgi:hypothetical protein